VKNNKAIRKKDQAFALLMTIAFTAGPFGFGVPIVFACASWATAWVCLVYVIWNLEHTERHGRALKTAVAVLATVAIVYVTYPPIRSSYVKEKAKAMSGDLVAEDDGKDHTGDPQILEIGPNGQRLAWNGDQSVPMISAYYDKIQMKMVKGKVYLSTTVHDDAKNLIVEIVDNHWIVSSATASCWDHNYTSNSLEVRDGHGRVVLQVKIMPNVVQLQEEWQWNPGTPNGGIIQSGWYDDKNGIKRIFKYPSELYWGQLRDSPGY
jgi:hypothetical protein